VESRLHSYVSRKISSAGSVLALLSLLLALKGHCIRIIHALLITLECCMLDPAFSGTQCFSCAEAKGAVLTDLRKVRILYYKFASVSKVWLQNRNSMIHAAGIIPFK